ncbi:hypothetical protein T08_8032 [Trichinella sp. T8]|nr:hypothetical protein T08_8032 [Trichinella sp. T8]
MTKSDSLCVIRFYLCEFRAKLFAKKLSNVDRFGNAQCRGHLFHPAGHQPHYHLCHCHYNLSHQTKINFCCIALNAASFLLFLFLNNTLEVISVSPQPHQHRVLFGNNNTLTFSVALIKP